MRHIEVNQLWLQGKVASKEIIVDKVNSNENLADALTKGVDSETLQYHIKGVGAEIRSDRHRMAPTVQESEEEQE